MRGCVPQAAQPSSDIANFHLSVDRLEKVVRLAEPIATPINFNPIETVFQVNTLRKDGRVSTRFTVLAFTVLSCVPLIRFSTDRKRREIQMRTQIGQKLEEGGERERLKELLRIRLKECGWRDQLKEHCRGTYGHTLWIQSTMSVEYTCKHPGALYTIYTASTESP